MKKKKKDPKNIFLPTQQQPPQQNVPVHPLKKKFTHLLEISEV